MANTDPKNTGGEQPEALYKVDRVFVGDRTAEEVVADLIKVHAQDV